MWNKIKSGINLLSAIMYAKITNKIIPLEVSLQLTNKCNLRCLHCYADLESVKSIKESTSAEIFTLIDQLIKRGTRWIRLLGGEPLLREDIGEIINYVKSKGIICELFSNGYLVKDKIGVLQKIDFLNISLDGDRVINDRLRGQGAYDKALEALVLAKKHKINVKLHCTPNRSNLHALEHIANLAQKHKVLVYINEYAIPANRELPDLKLREEDYQELYSRLKELKDKGYPVLNSSLALKYVTQGWPLPGRLTIKKDDSEVVRGNSSVTCQMGIKHFFIDVDANIYSCPRRWKQGISFKSAGIDQALAYAADRDCLSCRELGCWESYSVFTLNPKALLYAAKYYLTGS